MDRLCRLLALLRASLVALALCLLGAEPIAEPIVAATEAGPQPAHSHGVGLPDPSPAVASERAEDPRRTAEDDDPGHSPRAHLVVLAACARRVQMLRGPPRREQAVAWRPRSSRGPPVQV